MRAPAKIFYKEADNNNLIYLFAYLFMIYLVTLSIAQII
jgi:hypothetical protein